MNKTKTAELQKTILTRYNKEWRKLPRRETKDPYAIHISEVMSQQTQVDRVIPYRNKWMKEIPDYNTLAKLSKINLLTYRSWLWFNSRAIRLQECAKQIIEQYNWILPHNKEALLSLPWIGPYTASAICSFARNLPEPVIDTNIRLVLIFILKLPENISDKELEKIAKDLIPEWKSRDWHNALMDYWAIHLTARKTKIKSKGKQSKFEGSDREVRGRIIKQITKTKQPLHIKKIQEEFPNKNITKILDELKKENIIKEQEWYINIV